ncbi:MAG: GTPase HflX [bacterium]|nr:GTPase HflX [bacterium]
MIDEAVGPQRALLVSVHIKGEDLSLAEESLKELENLALTLDFEVVGQVIQSRSSPDSRTFLGQGKLEEIQQLAESAEANLLIVDHELSPNQGKNLEREMGFMVIDRTQLILEIFFDHAKTPEAKAQVELAQLKYMLPRLVGMWAHLDREKGGIGASRGTGEKQINIDRTIIRNRIAKLEKILRQAQKDRGVQSKSRRDCYQVAIVGYTNAGKTTLMHELSGLNQTGENKLFATLESRTRQLEGFSNPDLLLSDTVGFIQNLPHGLVASFRSTLSVVREADLLMHVADANSPILSQHLETTFNVLGEIGAGEVPQILVFNKADLVTDPERLVWLKSRYPGSIAVSSFDREGLAQLLKLIQGHFAKNFISQELLIPYNRSEWVNRVHQLAQVKSQAYEEEGVRITYRTTAANQKMLESLMRNQENK